MKLRTTVILLVFALLPAGYASGQAIFTEFTGTEMAAGPPSDFGTVSCPGGRPTGFWPTKPGEFPTGPPCTPGSRIHLRGMKSLYIVLTDDPRLWGLQEVVVNGNFDGWRTADPGSGNMWGTLRFQVMSGIPPGWTPTGEVWEGTFTGARTITGDEVVSSFQDVAHGGGGKVEGLQAKWHVTLNPVTGAGECAGRILAPGGK